MAGVPDVGWAKRSSRLPLPVSTVPTCQAAGNIRPWSKRHHRPEVSGIVAAVGPVTEWSAGQGVVGRLAPNTLPFRRPRLPIPPSVNLVDSAALPEVACTVVEFGDDRSSAASWC